MTKQTTAAAKTTEKAEQLRIGDQIGFVRLAQEIDENDTVVYFPVVQITTRDGEVAYRYQYPDGEISRSAIRQSEISAGFIRVKRKAAGANADAVDQSKASLICLSDRRKEFITALQRADDGNLEVLPYWELDKFFVVVNKENDHSYRVSLVTIEGHVFADCECADFKHRSRICKHISAVLAEKFMGVSSGAASKK